MSKYVVLYYKTQLEDELWIDRLQVSAKGLQVQPAFKTCISNKTS